MCVLQRLILLVKGNFQYAWNKKEHASINTGNDCTQMPINHLGAFNFFNSSLLVF